MTFQLSPDTDKNKTFLVNKSNLSGGRFDVNFYLPKYINSENLIRNSKWGFESVSDIAERIVDGPFGSDLKADEYQDSGFPLLRVSNIRTGSIDGELVYISSEKHDDLKRSKVFPNDVLLTKAGAILGYSAVFPSELIEGNITSHLVTITCASKINPYYLSYFFRSEIGQLQIYRWGNKSTRPELNTGEVKKILVTMPPLDMQNEIVNKFDDCYKAKYKKESESKKLLDSIDDYLLGELGVNALGQEDFGIDKRIFMRKYSDVSGGRLAPLFYSGTLYNFIEGSCFSFEYMKSLVQYMKSGFASGKQDQSDSMDGVIQIRPTNVNADREFVFDRNVYIDKKELENRINDILLAGEVLFNNTNSQELVGKSIYFNLVGSYFCSNHITRVMPIENKITSEYLTLIFNLYQRKNLFYKICTNWNNQSGVNIEQLSQVKIPVPPLEKQREIVAHIAHIRQKAKQLREEAEKELEQAKAAVERMILGDNEV